MSASQDTRKSVPPTKVSAAAAPAQRRDAPENQNVAAPLPAIATPTSSSSRRRAPAALSPVAKCPAPCATTPGTTAIETASGLGTREGGSLGSAIPGTASPTAPVCGG